MSKVLLDIDYENAYYRKKKNSEDRSIEFKLSLQEYKIIMKSRGNFTCGYTQRNMILNKGSSHKDYPQMDRINENKPYEKGNIIFCRGHVHKLKTDYIELGKSRKGLNHEDLCIIRSIEKVLNQPMILEQRLKPYTDLWKSLESPITPAKTVVQDMEALREQSIQLEKKSAEKALQEQIEAKIKREQDFAEHYVATSKKFQGLGVAFNLSMKDFRDMMRIKKDKVTEVAFTSTKEKHLYILNKSLPVTKENCKVVHKKTQEALDYMTNGDTKVLKQAVKNLSKIV